MIDDFQQRLDQLKATGEARRTPDCPPESKLLDLAAGLLPESEASGVIEHSTGCDSCGLLLRQATEDFSEDLKEGEEAQISSLHTAQAEGRRALARKLAAGQTKRPQPAKDWVLVPAWKPQFAWVLAAAAVVLLVAGTRLVQMQRAPSIDQLIASAYTEQRPFEPRIAGAAFGPVRQVRAGQQSSFGQPADLLRAKYLVKEKLAARPDDAAGLAARGKVELLEGHNDEAIRTFGRLLDVDPDSPELLTNLAIAYFQRAEAGDRAIDYGQAIEFLSRALAKTPDDPVALFNRALALEKMDLRSQAIRDWEHYLRVDPSGDWATEARRRLSELREKMKAREKPAALLRNDPAAAAPLLRARVLGHVNPEAPWAVSLDEEYLDLAVREWLPSLYVSVESQGRQSWRRNPVVWDALTATAEVLRTHHRDQWLADFLRELPGESASPRAIEQFAAALDSLSRAAKANAAGDPDSARPLAESAARSFRVVRSNAGLLRAREEIIYSFVRGARAARAQECIQAAGKQLHEAHRDFYAWLKTQAILWQATCHGAAGNIDVAHGFSDHALEFTRTTGYTGQNLRSILFAAGFLHSTERNWQETHTGLQKFWSDWHNPFHAYESYEELAALAVDAERWHLARLVRREAVGMVERTPDLLWRAVAHYRLAAAARRVRDLPEAEAEFRIASRQFGALSRSSTIQSRRTVSEIDLAAVEVQQGRLDTAAERLEQAKLYLAGVSDGWTIFTYHQTRGQLHVRQGNLFEAEKELWNALKVSEARLRSLQADADRLTWERDARQAYRTLVELYARKPEGTARALEVWEWYRASPLRGSSPVPLPAEQSFLNADAGAAPASLSRVRDAIPTLKHETVVSFARLPSGFGAWAFDDRGVNFAWVAGSPEDLSHRVKHFAFLCADSSSDLANLQQEGRRLYDLLLAPFERQLVANRILIVEPDSVLSEVPWPALVDSRGEYLGSKVAIVVSPGLGYWLNLRPTEPVSPGQRALVVGMPALSPAVASRFSTLPEADREAQGVAARFRNPRLLSGMEVTPSAIRQELPRSAVFHFAGHAVSRAIGGGLVLASLTGPNESDEPTLLSASHLEVGLQRLQLVVLSACATAETEKGFSEPDTLVRGFLRAGVPNIVASRWPVDSHTTELTMAEFYSRLLEGLPPAKALQQATNTLRLRPGTSHPYFWGAFSAYGR